MTLDVPTGLGVSRFDDTHAPLQLREQRNALGLTQARLAAAVGVTPNTVARWERSEQPIGHPERVRRALDQLVGEASAAAPSEVPFRLPLDLSSFIGRDRELDDVKRLLGAH